MDFYLNTDQQEIEMSTVLPQAYHIYTAFRVLSDIDIYRLCSFRIGQKRSPPMKKKLLWWRGTNSIYNFNYHSIIKGAVDNT
jgi:hypothetical protein